MITGLRSKGHPCTAQSFSGAETQEQPRSKKVLNLWLAHSRRRNRYSEFQNQFTLSAE
jgi:hypothetical protein